MKVATRITAATSVVVAIASAGYAAFDLRDRVAERRMAVEREARAVAHTIRVPIEAVAARDQRDAKYRADQLQREIEAIEKVIADAPTGTDPVTQRPLGTPAQQRQLEQLRAAVDEARGIAGFGRPLDLARAMRLPTEPEVRELGKASGGWFVTMIPRTRVDGVATDTGLAAPQLGRIRTLIEVPTRTFTEVSGGQFVYAVPVRVTPAPGTVPIVIGMLEVAKPVSEISMTSDDLTRALILIVLIVLVTTIVIGAVATAFVNRPITKLLRGIDDVAKGDLSHVILSEHDDEIGAIATRFNEMTFSLRESRGETLRQNEVKLALEQRLGQSEKLATIGQLAAEIAHEVGTPLNVIAGRARSIQRKSRDPETVEKNASIVAEQTARITRIIQRLLDFTRRKVGSTEKTVVDLNDLVATTLELLAGQCAAAKVRTRVERAESLPRVAGDSDRLQQVLINLVLNAVQAMPDGGALVIGTSAVTRARPGLEGNDEQLFVGISVSDTGPGIPLEIRDKIFDPFYTTKEGTGGTGLGLAVCSGIVKEHDGWIEIDDAATDAHVARGDSGAVAATGTVFRVFLPA